MRRIQSRGLPRQPYNPNLRRLNTKNKTNQKGPNSRLRQPCTYRYQGESRTRQPQTEREQYVATAGPSSINQHHDQ